MAGETVLTERCACGVKIRYLPKHVGRTVKCRSCGSGVTLAGPDAPRDWNAVAPDDDEDAYGVAAPAVKLPGMSIEAQARLASDTPAPTITPPSRLLGRESQVEARRKRGFWRDAGQAFLFWRTPTGAIALFVATLLLLLRDLMALIPLIGLIATIMFTGMVWGFYLQVIQYTAGGDDDLPDPSEWDGFIESAVIPIVTFMAVTGMCAIPAVGAAIAGAEPMAILVATACGAFLWPVAMLAASIGGAGAAMRIDLLIRTIVSALLPYLYVWFMLIVAVAANTLALSGGLGMLPEPAAAFLSEGVPGAIVATFTSVYTSIITMKLIGLYYRHYSDRFPWDAG